MNSHPPHNPFDPGAGSTGAVPEGASVKLALSMLPIP